ncbi:alpha-glucosidase [Kineococcus xinjiangensis]|uniref:Alpha-glucosidase n=1 Tax=Kineococcus xinjiangensis TaxID=512762 RepID=A0A2S6IW55_9ACTN|nr:glycoside hydrolase family 13 protein [Kineococcus xinjiangensis]PPK98470.1 alpha-glucosidase [Kineococcus xinjiangensis]
MKISLTPHHDGSPRYVPRLPSALGETVRLRVRVPRSSPYAGVALRWVTDGEAAAETATVVAEDESDTWYEAQLPFENPVTRYRFVLLRADGGFDWLNGSGVHSYDPPDTFDFALTRFGTPPQWARAGVVYQIFPDRFARSADADARPVPAWAQPQPWDAEPAARGHLTSRQFYGGDLRGIEEHLDHLAELGVGTVYLTPVFPARSCHRYDAASFDEVDPLLGGDEALASLSAALHERGMRLVGDLTTNHTGDAHEWFTAARADARSVEAGYYLWRSHPDDYVSWLGVPSLPKLDWSSPELRKRFADGADSVVARWLQPPVSLDGWRIDVANMTGRHRDTDLAHDVARTVRGTMEAVRPDGLVVGELMHDGTADLTGDGWHAGMNYAGFTRPVWTWLAAPDNGVGYLGMPVTIPRRSGEDSARAMREFSAMVPWQVATSQWNSLDSHDTPRLLTLLRDEALVEVAVGLQMTYPGTPVVYAGDEWGLQGETGEHGRVPMPWDDPARRDPRLHELYRELIALRNDHPALQEGGMRWLLVSQDALAYLREDESESLLVLAARAEWEGAELPADLPGLDSAVLLRGGPDLQRDGTAVRLPGTGPALSVWRLR